MYLSVFGCIFYGLGMAGYHTYAVCQKDPNTGAQMWVMPFVMMNALVAVLVFISSCIISVGFGEFCSSLLSGKDQGATLSSCADGETLNWNLKGTDYDATTYFGFMKTAEVTSWISTLIWCTQTGLCILRFVRNRRLRSKEMFTDPTLGGPSDLERVAEQSVNA